MPEFNDKRLMPPEGQASALQVRAGAVSIREAPLADARLATQALHGEVLDVYKQQHGFALVQCRRDRYVGWVAPEGLSDDLLTPTHRIITARTHAYAAPDLKSPPQAVLSLGAQMHVTGEEDDWRHCEGAGWVHQRHLGILNDRADDPVAVAMKFLHTPYLWGGRESLGIDCTGLTQQAFEAAGVLLPRDSDMQFDWCGVPVEDWQAPGVLQAGDLVFWKGHVGIMADAGHLLHANAWHMAVAVEPLTEAMTRIAKYYAEPIGARRIDISSERGEMPAWKAGAAA